MVAVKTRKKEVSKSAPEQPDLLYNEEQATIMNNDLTIAANEYAKWERQARLCKDKLSSTKRTLIEEMKKAKLMKMTMGQTKVIKYKFTDAKEDIVLQDFKPKVPRRRKF